MLGKPMMMGPYRRNIADIAEMFEQAGALQGVNTALDIHGFWLRSLDSEEREIMSKAALTVMDENTGALDHVLESMLPALERVIVE